MLCRKAYGVYRLGNSSRCRVPPAAAAIAVRAARSVEHDSTSAGATGVDGEKQVDCSARFPSASNGSARCDVRWRAAYVVVAPRRKRAGSLLFNTARARSVSQFGVICCEEKS
jgi:hypothetical protein